MSFAAQAAGTATRFIATAAHRKLKPGTHTLNITATDSTGKSKTRTIKITILKG